MTDHLHPHHFHGAHQGTFISYAVGFATSIALTLVAFGIVFAHTSGALAISGPTLAATLVLLAIIQLVVQLFTFLHLGRESSPSWNLITFCYAAVLLLSLVLGTIWIMNNLNYNMMMTPDEMNTYMLDQ